MAEGTPTPRKVTAAATQQDALPMRGMVLLGTFMNDKAPEALIRNSFGRIEKIGLGDKIGRQQVVAINPGLVVLMRNGATERLTMPRG